MSMRGLGVALLLALIGLAGGYAVGQLTREQPTTVAVAAPVPAHNPSYPVDPVRPFGPDIPYPALAPSLDYKHHLLGQKGFQRWRYDAPQGWLSAIENGDPDEVRWRPPGEPIIGGFSLRVKLVFEHKSKEAMVAQKLSAMQTSYQDVVILGQTSDLLSFSYRDPNPDRNTQRFNTFRWFSIPGQTEAMFEMSVVGRGADQPGLADLLQRVGASIEPLQ